MVMPRTGYKSITVNEKVYNKLVQLKRKWRKQYVSEVIEELLERCGK